MPTSAWFYVAMAAVASLGAVRLVRDVLLRRHLASVASSLASDDRTWLDAFARGIDNDREIINGYLRHALELYRCDPSEAARRLAFAREQVERSALPDALDALEILWRVLRTVPAVPHLHPWPGAPLNLHGNLAVAALAGIVSVLALTGRGRASVRLRLIERVLRRSARAFARATTARMDDTFEATGHPRLQVAARDLGSAQAALRVVAEELLLAGAAWERLSAGGR